MRFYGIHLGKAAAAARAAPPRPTSIGDILPFTRINTTAAASAELLRPKRVGDISLYLGKATRPAITSLTSVCVVVMFTRVRPQGQQYPVLPVYVLL